MSKKPRGKSGSAAGGGNTKWEAGLLAAPIDEESWNTSITLVVGNQLEDKTHLDMLSNAIKGGARRQFGVVHKASLFEEVKDLGNPKNKKTKESPPHMEICETVKPYLDNGDEIPLPLLCKLIKFKILYLKFMDQQRIANEKKSYSSRVGSMPFTVSRMALSSAVGSKPVSRRNSAMSVRQNIRILDKISEEASTDKDKGGKGGKGKDKPKSAKKGKGGKTPEPPSAKQGTKLKKRGEEDERVYIDDEPLDGTSFYVVITGFNHPHLLPQLAEIGIYADSVMKICSEDYEKYRPPPKNEEHMPIKDEKTLALEEEQRVKQELLKNELEDFWGNYPLLLAAAPEGSKLHDTTSEQFVVKEEWIPENLEDDKDGEKKLAYGMQIFEEVAVKAYDILDLKRQHKNFIKNLKLIHVPLYGEELLAARLPVQASPMPSSRSSSPFRRNTTPVAGKEQVIEASQALPLPDVDMRYYTDMMNTIPQESVSVPLIMHCMLEQIDAMENQREPPSEVRPPSRSDGLDDSLAKHIGGLAFKLALSNADRKNLLNQFENPKPAVEPFKQPVLYNANDDISFRTDHLDTVYGFQVKKAELDMLERIPLIGALEMNDLEAQTAVARSARLQELLHFCVNEEMSPADIDHAFRQFVFESMDITACEDTGLILPAPPKDGGEEIYGSAIPWDDPYPYYRCMLPKEQPKPATVATGQIPIDDEFLSGVSLSPSLMSEFGPSAGSSVILSEGGMAGNVKPGDKKDSRPSTPGILRKDNSRSASRNSVHFSDADDLADENTDEVTGDGLDPMEEFVPAAHKRDLDNWCFAEHLDRHVLLQVMKEASFTLPFIDTYYHKRDHCLLVVMHNPQNLSLENNSEWCRRVHTNVSTRNYQEHVAIQIADWTMGEEAKYQAMLLSGDVEQDVEDAAKAAATAAKDAKKSTRARSKSPKSRKGSAKTPPPKDGIEGYINDSFVREGSLKQQKAEQDKAEQERLEEERLKAEKATRSKSGRKTNSAKGKKGDKDDKKPSRSGSKTRQSKDEPANHLDASAENKEPEVYWPFSGYDMGNKLMHINGEVSTLFPTDGAIIRTEKIAFTQDSTSVKSSVVKDGNVFMVHVLEPTKIEDKIELEKSELEQSEKESKQDSDENVQTSALTVEEVKEPAIGKFAEFSAHMRNGMSLSFSAHGPTGQPDSYKKYEPAPYQPPNPRSPSPGPPEPKASPTKKGKGKTGSTPEPVQTDDELLPEVPAEAEEVQAPQPFQHLYMTCPDGLSLNFDLESSVGIKGEQRCLLVKQSYPNKTMGKHSCEEARAVPAMQEVNRVIRHDGTVIRNMADGSVIILYADGTVSKLTGVPAGQSIVPRPESPNRASSARSGREVTTPTRRGRKGRDQKTQPSMDEMEIVEPVHERRGQWITTAPTGERIGCKLDGTEVEVKNALVSYASDPESGQMLITREDHVSIVSFPNDMKIVEHEDGTRITTFLKEVERDSTEDTEKQDESPVFKQQFVRVECRGYAALEFNCYTSYCMVQLGNDTLMSVMPNGSYYLYDADGFNLEVDEKGNALYVPNPRKQLLPAKAGVMPVSQKQQFNDNGTDIGYMMNHREEVIVQTTDPDGNLFCVKKDGSYTVTLSQEYQELIAKQQGRTNYRKHAPRFFVVRPDMSATEILRYQDIATYLQKSEQDIATAVLKEPVLEYPGVTAITVLKPYVKNSSQHWLANLASSSIIPPGLRSRDLKTLPPREIKSAGPKFGTTVGRGLAIGSAVKPPAKPTLLECPKKLEMRQIIQYKPISAVCRDGLYKNLKLYADYVVAREGHAEDLKPNDPRSVEGQMASSELLTSNKNRIMQGDIKSLYEKVTAPPIPSPPSTPVPRRTQADVERDKREKAEEFENRRILRGKEVPPYFQSEIGRAFLISNASDPAGMLQNLAEDPRQDNSSSIRGAQPLPCQTMNQHTGKSPFNNQRLSPTSKTRPQGPTPVRASGEGSPVSLRPQNPTPAHAGKSSSSQPDRPGNPTPKNAGGNTDIKGVSPVAMPAAIQEYPTMEFPDSRAGVDESWKQLAQDSPSDLYPFSKSLKYDVNGNPRNVPVHVPDYITMSSRPQAFPNEKFEQVEEQVRRQVKTSSVAHVITRGFELLPDSLDFGTLKEGVTYSFNVHLKNVGVDTCRYRIKQPPPSTGLRVIFVPGPIAAGMKAELKLELYAIAVGVVGENGKGMMTHDLEIITETDVLRLPIRAQVFTSEYQSKQNVVNGPNPGVRIVTDKPPNDYGIVRPRKDLKVASNGSDAVLSFSS